MIKAHSLLYAIYICLIVAVICGALLYLSTLYAQLNLYYNLNEDLYIENQSYTNLALGSENLIQSQAESNENGIFFSYENKPYGILNKLQVQTWTNLDTVTSVLLTGTYNEDKTSLYVANLGSPFYYSGTVKLIGNNKLPTERVQEKYINNEKNSFYSTGKIALSTPDLPELNPEIKLFFENAVSNKVSLKDFEKNSNSIYFNSFANKTIEILLPEGAVLENVFIKGNIVLNAKDSVVIRSSANLEDVIVRSPKIIIEDDFKGSLQLFATEKIDIGKNVHLEYPSLLCLYAKNSTKCDIVLNENSTLAGAAVLYDNSSMHSENTVVLAKGTLVTGEIYCTGKLMVAGKVHGSVYSNKVFHKTPVSLVDNCLVDSEIDVTKKPAYYVSVPIFKTEKKKSNGVFKKVL